MAKVTGFLMARFFFIPTALLVFILGLYSGVKDFSFISYDDPTYISENPIIQGGLNSKSIWYAFTSTEGTNLWHPITWVGHIIDIELFGLNPGLHHLVQVILFILVSIGLYLLALQHRLPAVWALLAIALWISNPSRVESIAWLSEKKDLLAALFGLATVFSFRKVQTDQTVAWQASTVVLFVLACLSKPSVVVIPTMIIALLFARNFQSSGQSSPSKKEILILVLLQVIAAFVAAMTIYWQRVGGMATIVEQLPLITRLQLMPSSFGWYLERFFVPTEGVFFNYPPKGAIDLFLRPFAWISASIFVVYRYRRIPGVIAGALIYCFFWFPVSGIVPVSGYYVADRYALLPHIGLVVILVSIVSTFNGSSRVIAIISASILTIAGACLTTRQLPPWRDTVSLFTREMERNPRSLLAPVLLGDEALEAGDYREALKFFKKAEVIDPLASLPATQIGRAYRQMGDLESAVNYFRQAISKETVSTPQPFLFLGEIYLEKGDKESLSPLISEGISKFPDNLRLRILKLRADRLMGRSPEEVLRSLNFLLDTNHSQSDLLFLKMQLLIELKRYADALAIAKILNEEIPNNPQVRMVIERLKDLKW